MTEAAQPSPASRDSEVVRVSATEPDWSREAVGRGDWVPGKRLLLAIRCYQHALSERSVTAPLSRRWAVLEHRFWSAVTGAEIPLNAQLGGGLLIPHPNGIVIHPDASLGPNCLLFQQVTIGTGSRPGVPRIGGHVDIGAGAKVLGGVVIGDHVKIGANSVVIEDVPDGATVVGAPARIVVRG